MCRFADQDCTSMKVYLHESEVTNAKTVQNEVFILKASIIFHTRVLNNLVHDAKDIQHTQLYKSLINVKRMDDISDTCLHLQTQLEQLKTLKLHTRKYRKPLC